MTATMSAPRPWDWTTSVLPTANGLFHIYIVDATGRKIGAVWGKPAEKQATAELIVTAVNAYATVTP